MMPYQAFESLNRQFAPDKRINHIADAGWRRTAPANRMLQGGEFAQYWGLFEHIAADFSVRKPPPMSPNVTAVTCQTDDVRYVLTHNTRKLQQCDTFYI